MVSINTGCHNSTHIFDEQYIDFGNTILDHTTEEYDIRIKDENNRVDISVVMELSNPVDQYELIFNIISVSNEYISNNTDLFLNKEINISFSNKKDDSGEVYPVCKADNTVVMNDNISINEYSLNISSLWHLNCNVEEISVYRFNDIKNVDCRFISLEDTIYLLTRCPSIDSVILNSESDKSLLSDEFQDVNFVVLER